MLPAGRALWPDGPGPQIDDPPPVGYAMIVVVEPAQSTSSSPRAISATSRSSERAQSPDASGGSDTEFELSICEGGGCE